jgi:glycosyltransferase involved in cell wall biosynthesis
VDGSRARPVAVLQGQLGYGGSERQLALFLKAHDPQRWAPHVYAASHLGPVADEIRAAGIPVTLLEGTPLQKLVQFRHDFRQQGAQGLVSWSSWTNVFSWLPLGRRVPRMGSFRSAGFADLPRRYRPVWAWASHARLSTIVCNSPETAAELRRRTCGRQRVRFVPNAVEPVPDVSDRRAAWRRELGVRPDEVLVMGVGRLSPQKAFERFVDAVALCHASHPVRAVILGPDYEGAHEALLSRIEATGLAPGTIRYLGPTDAARDAICAADVYLLSSLEEGMPNVVLEALSAGVPCVTTPVSGISTILTHGVEGLVAEHDAASLGESLLRLARNPALRQQMGARARDHLAEALTPMEVYGPLWDALAEELREAQTRRRRGGRGPTRILNRLAGRPMTPYPPDRDLR